MGVLIKLRILILFWVLDKFIHYYKHIIKRNNIQIKVGGIVMDIKLAEKILVDLSKKQDKETREALELALDGLKELRKDEMEGRLWRKGDKVYFLENSI